MMRNQISIFLVVLIFVVVSVFADEKEKATIVKVGSDATLEFSSNAFTLTYRFDKKDPNSKKDRVFTRTYSVKRQEKGFEIRLTEKYSEPRFYEAYLLVTAGTAEKYQAVFVRIAPKEWPPVVTGLRKEETQTLFETVDHLFRFAELVEKNMSMLSAQQLFDKNETLKKEVLVMLNKGFGRYIRIYIRILPRDARDDGNAK